MTQQRSKMTRIIWEERIVGRAPSSYSAKSKNWEGSIHNDGPSWSLKIKSIKFNTVHEIHYSLTPKGAKNYFRKFLKKWGEIA